jgi:uncharacterized protein YecE (DUF72 family)
MSRATFHLGSCSWVYDHWRGVFYPSSLARADWLGWYARHFNAVEVDATFYAVPRREVVERWHAVTPPGFQFTVKLPRVFTHERHLAVGAGEVAAFLKAMEPLGEKLSAVLVQLPPSFQPARHRRVLQDFLALLPERPRFAVEFRDRAWHAASVEKALRDAGAALCWNDLTPPGSLDALGVHATTSDFVYVRLLGDLSTKYDAKGERVHVYDRVQWERPRDLDAWGDRLRAVSASGALRDVYVFSNNHYEGYTPATVTALRRRLGLPEPAPPESTQTAPERGGQMDLFPL